MCSIRRLNNHIRILGEQRAEMCPHGKTQITGIPSLLYSHTACIRLPTPCHHQGHFTQALNVWLQLLLCGQGPETALSAALASVNFYLQQQQLLFAEREAEYKNKLTKTDTAARTKLKAIPPLPLTNICV